MDMCIEFWKLLLPKHFALLETWIQWVEQNVKNHVSKADASHISSLLIRL